MKTNRTKTTATLLLSLILIISHGIIFGQGRANRERSDDSRNSGTRYGNNSVNDNIRNERSSYNYSRSRGTGNNTYEYTPAKHAKKDNKKDNSSNLYMHSGHNSFKENHHYYHKHATYSYHRPVTYHTWHYPAPWAYAPNAIVFRHHHGDYFFHHGRFYRYHPVRGYYRVAAPRTVVFSHLPVGYEAVYVGGGLFYRYGEVFFEYTPYGYRIISRPGGMVVSVKF